MNAQPRITFGIIVLNGEPFTRYCLRSLYPFAHQIIVVEGAAPAAKNIATTDGHSRDGTLDILRQFKATEDPNNKLTIVTAEDEGHTNGFWPGEKNEMSQAYAKRATGNYLWQVDVDEFYNAEDMKKMIAVLRHDPSITAVTFKQLTFWGGLDYVCDGWYLRRGAAYYHRLFQWAPGYQYTTHRPPTVVNKQGRDLRQIRWVDGRATEQNGILLYHYSLLFPKQVQEKCDYYGNADWARRKDAQRWADECFMNLKHPFRVHNVYSHISWLTRYTGSHPQQIAALWEDCLSGKVTCMLRESTDIECLITAPWYKLARFLFRLSDYPWRLLVQPYVICRRFLGKCTRYLRRMIHGTINLQ
jgi:hypothetical protein